MTDARCAICDKPIPETTIQQDRCAIFCSERCRRIDLARWLDGRYRVTQPILTELEDPESP
jgi:endogenous inhibitor of DNA gyrase (YacG/DUF329 family)